MKQDKTILFFLFYFCTLYLFLPIELPFFEWKNNLILPAWQAFFQVIGWKDVLIFSDSHGFFYILFTITVLSVPFFVVFQKWWFLHYGFHYKWMRIFLLACLFLIFGKYGLDKLMHLQFPKPEPNILYTQLGNLNKDILFWTSIGTSKVYNVSTGLLEIFGALSLLFYRTKRIGLFLLLLSSLYIVLINFSFNIGVKLFSLTLLGTLITLNWNTLHFLFVFFSGFKEKPDNQPNADIYATFLKLFIGSACIIYMYILNKENTLENDVQGVYKSMDQSQVKYLFINQQNYWIEENWTGHQKSYKIAQLGNKHISYHNAKGTSMYFSIEKKEHNTYVFIDQLGRKKSFQKLDISNKNALQDDFMWIVQ